MRKLNIQIIENLNIFKEKLFSFEKLKKQGFNNVNYLLKTSKKEYIVRVFKSKDSVNISREFEFKVQNKAYEKNIASKAIFLNDHLMIYEYSKGFHKNKLKKHELIKLVLKIKKVHNLKITSNIYNLEDDLYMYKRDLIYEKHIDLKKSKKLIKNSFKSLKKLKKLKVHLGLVHHDLNPKNIIFSKYGIKIIDWEYAGTNDIFFDLASICIEFNLSKEEEKLLLYSYFPRKKSYFTKKLLHYKKIYKNLCELWFLKNS